jgi:hypothetical protein
MERAAREDVEVVVEARSPPQSERMEAARCMPAHQQLRGGVEVASAAATFG